MPLSPYLIRPILFAVMLLAAPLRPGLAYELPDLGDASRQVISTQEETELGRRFMQQLELQGLLLHTPLVESYIQNLGLRLVSHSRTPAAKFTFFVVDDPSINAFALPGGYIGIHTGLILASRNESELAGVISHEIAHVTQRHLARRFEEAKRMQIPMALALLAAVFVGGENAQLGQAAVTTLAAGNIQQQLDFTRAHEQEADALGIGILIRAGFDAEGMASFFARLEQETRYNQNQAPEFLRTHPVHENRIAEARNRARRQKHRPAPGTLDYPLTKALLMADLAADKPALAEHFKRTAGLNVSQRYTYARLLLNLARFGEAEQQFLVLLDQSPEQPAFIIGLSQAELELGRNRKALQRLQDAMRIYPGNYPLTLQYAEALMRADRAAQARDLLQEFSREHKTRPMIFRQLARAAARAGDPVGRHLAQAEYEYLTGNLHGALQQLEQASAYPDVDYYRQARIADRIRQLKREASVFAQRDHE